MTKSTTPRIAIPPGWRSMRTAPRDGTIILVCETPNGEAWNVVPAAYQIHAGVASMEEFWGVCVTSRVPAHLPLSNETAARERGLPVGFKAIAITPLCWQPLPECEPIPKLWRPRPGREKRHFPLRPKYRQGWAFSAA